MRRICFTAALAALCLDPFALRMNVMDGIAANPQKAYGTDYPYTSDAHALTKSPKGCKPFYMSHYVRHGSHYYWSNL